MDARDVTAQRIVEKHMWYAAGAGLVPVPYFDMAAITAVDVRMIKELAEAYGVEWVEERGKTLAASLLGGVGAGMLARNVTVNTVIRAIPLVGQAAATLSMSIFGGAATYALGRVFTQHFVSGGTLLDFDPESARTYVSEQFQKGKRAVLRQRTPAAAAATATA
jgi:uncharacterized protein (DUF697 family)